MSVTSQTIPLDVVPYFEQSVSLAGQLYITTFAYNETAEAWYMDLKQADGVSIVEGLRLVASYPMLLDYSLEQYGINGALYLLPLAPVLQGDSLPIIGDDVKSLATYYSLQYIYTSEE